MSTILKWAGYPMTGALWLAGLIARSKEAQSWGPPDWAWMIAAFAVLLAVAPSTHIGLWRENKALKKKSESGGLHRYSEVLKRLGWVENTSDIESSAIRDN